MIRPRGGTTRRRDDQQEQAIATIVEIGKRLRGAREERGLSLLAVHDRLSRPITQLEALENGDLASLPDQALAISTLRRYATFLGLDGDALALKMIDAWSASPYASRQAGAPVASVVAAVSAGPDHLRAFTQTGKVPKVSGRTPSAPAGSATNGHEIATGPPTGTFPVVPRRELRQSRRAVARARRQLRAPRSLKVLTWAACLLVLAALVGLGIRQWHPQWLVSSHILRVVQPGSQNGHAAAAPSWPVTQPASATQPADTTTPSAHHHQTSAVAAGLAGPGGEAYTVNTSRLHGQRRHLGSLLGADHQLGSAPPPRQRRPAGREAGVPAREGDDDGRARILRRARGDRDQGQNGVPLRTSRGALHLHLRTALVVGGRSRPSRPCVTPCPRGLRG